MKPNSQNRPFKLMHWFGWLSSIVIIGIAIAQALLISSFMTTQFFQREGELSRDFVQNVLVADGSLDYLLHSGDPVLAARFSNTTEHFKNMHDLLRVNIFKLDGSVLWSNNPELIGKKFPAENDELDEALKGELVINPVHIWVKEKTEHVGIDPSVEYFIESYIPVLDPVTRKVVGVVEFYRAPIALTNAIMEGRVRVWLIAFVSALGLFGALYWIVRRADATIKHQHSRLIETETLAVVGELTSSVAHSIRNPLSSIRSSAEWSLESPEDDCTEQAKDIIYEVDRIGKLISELLKFSSENVGKMASVDLAVLLEECVSEHQYTFEHRQQTLTFSSSTNHPLISADRGLLKQVLHSLMSNATEAMDAGGRCEIRLSDENEKSICIEVEDNGCGITPEVHSQIFRPFFTTKPKGLGLGLPQARKIVERFSGTIQFLDKPGKGVIAKITFPKA